MRFGYMPYRIVKEGDKYRIKTPTHTLKGHYKSKESALKVVRKLYSIGK